VSILIFLHLYNPLSENQGQTAAKMNFYVIAMSQKTDNHMLSSRVQLQYFSQ